MSRDERNQAAPYGPDKSKYYMELNAPKWKETIRQGDVRPAFFGDVVTQVLLLMLLLLLRSC